MIRLNSKDKQFCSELARDYEIHPEVMEDYLRDLLDHLKTAFKSQYLIHKVKNKEKRSLSENNLLKCHKQFTISYIDWNWEIPKFRKCIIAAQILLYYKLDDKIKTKEQYDKEPNDSAQSYKHYLYNYVKNRFKVS